MKSLKELKLEDVPRATADAIGMRLTINPDYKESDEAKAEQAKAYTELNEYLKDFCSSKDCPRCGLALRGKGILHAILGGFTWGLANGEGHCTGCNYPCRAYHRNVGPLEFFEFVLAYHPSALSEPADKRELANA